MIIINDSISINTDEKIILDEGFFFGKGVFETILVKDKPIFLEEHLHRLNRGLKILGINKSISDECVLSNLNKIIKINKININNYALKIMVSEKNIIFTTREVPYLCKDYDKGFSLKISDVKRNPYSNLTNIKSFNYIENILEREKAIKENFNEVLFLNTDGYVAEGSTSNIFIVKDNVILTPKISCGILEGVVRNFLVTTLPQSGYEVYEKNISLKSFNSADGIFITNSLMGIMKINKIGNIIIPESKIVSKIKRFYDDYVENII